MSRSGLEPLCNRVAAERKAAENAAAQVGYIDLLLALGFQRSSNPFLRLLLHFGIHSVLHFHLVQDPVSYSSRLLVTYKSNP